MHCCFVLYTSVFSDVFRYIVMHKNYKTRRNYLQKEVQGPMAAIDLL